LFTITAAGHVTVSQDTAGTGKIDPSNISVRVIYKNPYATIPHVVVTAKGAPVVLGLIDESVEGFTVIMKQPESTAVFFNWIALATDEDAATVSAQAEPEIITPSVQQEPDPITVNSDPVVTEPTLESVIPPVTLDPEPILEPASDPVLVPASESVPVETASNP
jgi:hypothetical protein